MGKAQRDKGLLGEREVRHLFEQAGLEIRSLEGLGDNLVLTQGATFHVETKRREQLRLDEWSIQAEFEAPKGAVPLVCYRRSRQPWRVSLRLDDLLALLTRP